MFNMGIKTIDWSVWPVEPTFACFDELGNVWRIVTICI